MVKGILADGRQSILKRYLFILLATLLTSTARAQQPFVTDDADVIPKKRFHFEFSNEFDLLQRSAFPSLKQNNGCPGNGATCLF
jgi:hypothetical protein